MDSVVAPDFSQSNWTRDSAVLKPSLLPGRRMLATREAQNDTGQIGTITNASFKGCDGSNETYAHGGDRLHARKEPLHVVITAETTRAIGRLARADRWTRTKLTGQDKMKKRYKFTKDLRVLTPNRDVWKGGGNRALIWVPDYKGIRGSEKAEPIAKSGAAIENITPEPLLGVVPCCIEMAIRN